MALLITLFLSISGLIAQESNFQPVAPSDTLDQTTVFTQVHVLPMDGKGILENQTVTFKGDRIISIEPATSADIPDGAKMIDGKGKYLIPGLAEMHGHVPPTDPPSNFPDYFNTRYVENTLFLYMAAGITTVRGMLGYEGQLELKEQVNSGEIIGPNLYLAGPSFNGNSVSSPEVAREKVEKQYHEGWDLLKIHPGLTRAEYDAMAEKANELGIRFGGHVPEDVGILHALEMGQETMDHIDGYYAYLQSFEGEEREVKLKELVAKTKEAGAWIVPTQALWETIIGTADYEALRNFEELKYLPRPVVQNYHNYVQNNVFGNGGPDMKEAEEHSLWRKKILEEMNRQGVLILMGTDAPQLYSVPGFSIYRELPYMEHAGMTPYEILKSGTYNVGRYFSNEDKFGTIQEGMRADLLLVNKNPLEDLSYLKEHSGVMVQGRWYSREFINAKLREIEFSYKER